MPLFLAMQAAGMITDLFGTFGQQHMMDLGEKLQQAGINANIEQVRLQTEDASLQSMIQLRQTVGSQIALFAARGSSTVGGSSAFGSISDSFANFKSDDRMRRLNALGKENQLRAGNAMSVLQNSSDSSKLWQGFASRTFNTFGTMGGSSGSAFSGSRAGASEGFGLTRIGG